MQIFNINDLPSEFIYKDNSNLITKLLSKAVGTEKFYINIDIVPPQKYSTKYHSHSQQEEFFLILDGAGTLRFDNKVYNIKKGDFISKPSGKNIAHTFYNSEAQSLIILDIGTVEKEDICYYPDEDVYMYKSNDFQQVFHGDSVDKLWCSEPNQN